MSVIALMALTKECHFFHINYVEPHVLVHVPVFFCFFNFFVAKYIVNI